MSQQSDARLGIEFISVLGMPPPQFAALASELGVRHIGLAPAPFTANPHGFPTWNLLGDPGLLRETKDALRTHNVSVSVGEGFLVMPGLEMASAGPALDLMADLGAPLVNCCVVEQDRPRAHDEFARFAAMAGERGMIATVEFLPMAWPATLAEVATFLAESGAGNNGRLLIDAMHVFRSGATAADLAAIDPALIGYIQLCDVPMPATNPNYGEEARHNRMAPGEGDLPLADFLTALPKDLVVGLEVPMLAKAEAGIGTLERLTPAVATTRALLAASG
jgi:sugar phosphate isomerase/epimerase